ncbi:hypothetical protein QBC47DRAFT_126078 [Echria macrotheca]|uniref:Uncharacterized protein n=1 Tax=Echria macrotheca TaxID=438768 RepID=A0AAJ0B1X4_9PEZI|nr:hypothetical protein QBC47DRAFT_126078 [Echria macrotheca]
MSGVSIQKLKEFDPPGFPDVDDGLTPEQRQGWSDQISSLMNLEIAAKDSDGNPLPGPDNTNRTPLTQFFNGTVTAFETDQKPVAITWIGFPNLVKTKHPNAPSRWIFADADRNAQDEYLEWSILRDASDPAQHKRIISVTYTCEGPEYWQFLAENQPDTVSSLYTSLNPLFAASMKPTDWFGPDGVYVPANKWNNSTTTGSIAHLAQPNNTLGAEIDIAAQGTVIRKDANGHIITDKVKLINCSAYGQPERNSDPTIGILVNNLARQGASVSIANPVAIYIHSFNTATFQLDIEGTGQNMVDVPDGTFRWQRGNIAKNAGLRLQVQIPDGVVGTGENNRGRQLTVSDIVDTKNGQNILFGAQFADYITMTVKGVAISGGTPADPLPCPGAARRGRPAGFSALAMEGGEGADAEGESAGKPCDASKNARRVGTRW